MHFIKHLLSAAALSFLTASARPLASEVEAAAVDAAVADIAVADNSVTAEASEEVPAPVIAEDTPAEIVPPAQATEWQQNPDDDDVFVYQW